ncbi:PREDICTED: NADH dehydrogenase [ubiquinone] 1 alpha subcomplex subunit 9, mitochondrial [Papilio xuthus]|uniref:NADH dehydrogenase [ubiquinone] 1 alpha subcomplex subunit 9, mitochondrial n=1 Tax=Papilio xuthus TaxID=66420 RepID=I4DK06_PAPXU|nr:NADH dehydrogenase [ubiquinone] 1 alpha subcomplex subunit 9, mitochondrial [Papilio xuthus]KPI91213.1 NADH dehydrogenase [ubiquinone] 1 alpha subcomplex subunit 9, mitochondrial [Papilio xuthus]BAM18246.1 NADH-ubiquinone oxidoreductase 39 kda subunit [Papilio xuthus]
MAAVALSGNLANKIIPKHGALSIIYIKSASYSTDGKPNIAAYKRGTGGRSSFNGIVATVFGCTGFVGRYVCNKLGKIGTQMILPYRSDFYDANRLKVAGDLGQVLFTPFDIRDEESIAKAVKYSNVVINLVGRDYETKNFSYTDVHVDGPRRIARICREMGVERFIHLSYLNAERHPQPLVLRKPSMYKISKYLGECAVREEFPTATIFRASDIYGSEDRFIRSLATGWRSHGNLVPVYKNGMETIKQPVYVSDVAQGIVNAARDPDTRCQVYQAIGPKRYLLADLIDWFYKLMRKDRAGYRRYDMKYDPIFFSLRVAAANMLSPAYPFGGLHWEGLEKESTTDRPEKGVPTLEDLGVTLTPMEDQVPWELKPFRAYQYYLDKLGEFPQPPPPNAL